MEPLERNKQAALVHALNAKSTESAMGAISKDVIWHGPAGSPRTLEGWKARHARFLQAFDIQENRVDKVLAEGDMVFVEWSCTAIHQGTYLGIPATGKQVSVYGMYVDRIVDGQVVEHWGLQDSMGVVAQLGGLPQPEQPRSAN